MLHETRGTRDILFFVSQLFPYSINRYVPLCCSTKVNIQKTTKIWVCFNAFMGTSLSFLCHIFITQCVFCIFLTHFVVFLNDLEQFLFLSGPFLTLFPINIWTYRDFFTHFLTKNAKKKTQNYILKYSFLTSSNCFLKAILLILCVTTFAIFHKQTLCPH